MSTTGVMEKVEPLEKEEEAHLKGDTAQTLVTPPLIVACKNVLPPIFSRFKFVEFSTSKPLFLFFRKGERR
jgi:hypothetical protein